MSRIIYINGLYQPYENAYVHAEDRGFQFADGVYEVCEVRNNSLVDETRHMQRLARSMKELDMTPPMSLVAMGQVMRETCRRNRVKNGLVYIQVTRGAARRDFAYPDPEVRGTVVCLARKVSPRKGQNKAVKGLSVISVPDIRWQRPDIKTVSLLPNAMAKQAAKDQGADEAWMLDAKGYVTEGSSSNAWILTQDNMLLTRNADQGILRGITRTVLLDLLNEKQMSFKERHFTIKEAQNAKEAFLTSASNGVMPIARIDGVNVGDGTPGPISLMLRKEFYNQAEFRPVTN